METQPEACNLGKGTPCPKFGRITCAIILIPIQREYIYAKPILNSKNHEIIFLLQLDVLCPFLKTLPATKQSWLRLRIKVKIFSRSLIEARINLNKKKRDMH